MNDNSFQPKIHYKNGDGWYFFDGHVLAAIDGDVDFDLPEPPVGRSLLISEWTSNDPGRGHSKRALTWLRERFGNIVANGVGVIDDEGPDISTLFWAHMTQLGLVDGMLDDNSQHLQVDEDGNIVINCAVKPVL